MASGRPVTETEHAAWYSEVIASPKYCFFIIEAAGEPVGQVRYQRSEAAPTGTEKVITAKVSINITQSMHGRGIATEAFRLGSQHVRAIGFAKRVIAHVQEDNIGSIRALEKASFVYRERMEVHGLPHVVMSNDGDSRVKGAKSHLPPE